MATGLLFGWSIFKVFTRLSPATTKGQVSNTEVVHKLETQQSTSSNDNNTKVLIEIQHQDSALLAKKKEDLSSITKNQMTAEKCQFTSTEDYLAKARVRLANVSHLKDMFPNLKPLQSPLYKREQEIRNITTTLFAKPGTFCLQEKYYGHMSELQTSLKFLRSTASKEIYCDPSQTKAVIATCGGIVPGMNVVIRSLVKCLE